MIDKILAPVLSLGGLGLAFGFLLAYASKKFAVEVDERVEKILELLPSANCGGCGYAGCSSFAKAIVEGEAPVNGCPVCKAGVVGEIAEIMGASVDEDSGKKVAKVMCNGKNVYTKNKYDYYGIEDCVAASKLAGGNKSCPYGCLGLGSCVEVCNFDAIEIVDGIAKINKEKCVGCGKCVEVCPKNVIELVDDKQETFVLCKSKDKGKEVKQYCDTGCIGCKICEKQCKFDAIHVIDNIAIIDYNKCVNCSECVVKCPVGIIEGRKEDRKAFIIEDDCIGCSICKKQCKFDAIEGEIKSPHKVNEEKCVGCGLCIEKCPKKCIEWK